MSSKLPSIAIIPIINPKKLKAMAYLLDAFQNSTPLTRVRLSTSFFQTDVIDDIKYPLNPTSRAPIVGTIVIKTYGISINCPIPPDIIIPPTIGTTRRTIQMIRFMFSFMPFLKCQVRMRNRFSFGEVNGKCNVKCIMCS